MTEHSRLTIRRTGYNGSEVTHAELEPGETVEIVSDSEVVEVVFDPEMETFWNSKDTRLSELQAMYWSNGRSPTDIATDLGMEPSTVRRLIRKPGPLEKQTISDA